MSATVVAAVAAANGKCEPAAQETCTVCGGLKIYDGDDGAVVNPCDHCDGTGIEPKKPPDIADIIAGELKVSRGTAYDMMREALKEVDGEKPKHLFVEDSQIGGIVEKLPESVYGSANFVMARRVVREAEALLHAKYCEEFNRLVQQTPLPESVVKRDKNMLKPKEITVRKVNVCHDCANADSWGLPDKQSCNHCVENSQWVPLNASSKNPLGGK